MNWYKRNKKKNNEHPQVVISGWDSDGMTILIDNVRHRSSTYTPVTKDHLQKLCRSGKWEQAKAFCKTIGCQPE